ncbi:sulfated surface glycoprotein 185 [Eutrema salsugineum]|uniref:sulfated surface glycoprotein 185 n=1 Tax=Eutrema salsugineum TaxID=72664 RepID=UPI000CED1032|nr:sulfated surface glycoprotein 185 [Eutrema salsugineum]
MKSSTLLLAAFLCVVAFPTTTVGKNLRFWPKPVQGWPNPLKISKNDSPLKISKNDRFMMSTSKFNYEDSKVWRCTYSNGSAPAISISPSIPSTPSTPSPSPPTPKTSPPPPTPSPPPPTPKTSPPPPTPSLLPPPTPKKSPSPPPLTPSLPPPTPKKSPSPPPPTPKKPPSPPPPTPKKSPSPPPSTPSLPPPTPKKSPSHPPPSDDVSSPPSQPSNPPPEHHHGHRHHQNPWEHIDTCMRNMGPVTMCRAQMEFSFFTRMFQVSDYCCKLIVNMKDECDDVIWGFFTDPFFVPLVRCTCHVTY